jgi:hypothetical protein
VSAHQAMLKEIKITDIVVGQRRCGNQPEA